MCRTGPSVTPAAPVRVGLGESGADVQSSCVDFVPPQIDPRGPKPRDFGDVQIVLNRSRSVPGVAKASPGFGANLEAAALMMADIGRQAAHRGAEYRDPERVGDRLGNGSPCSSGDPSREDAVSARAKVEF
jgi:hypothetical protein